MSKAGQSKAGQSKAGQSKAGQSKAGQSKAGQNMFSRAVITNSKKYRTANYAKFTTVNESSYSSVMPYPFLQIGRILKKIFKNPKVIIDACAHIGGSSINIARIFPTSKIISVELKKSVFNVLKKNIEAFGYQKRIIPIHNNCIPFFKKITRKKKVHADFVNIDPPWGGPGYIKIKKLMLYLYNTADRKVPIYELINDIFIRNVAPCVTFKAPHNFNMPLFKRYIEGIVQIYPIYNKPKPSCSKIDTAKKGTSRKPPRRKRKIVYYYVVVVKR